MSIDVPVNTASDNKPIVTPFFEPLTSTFSYVVQDPLSNACAVIDSVLDFDYAAGHTSYQSADKIVSYIKQNNLKLEWIIETHVHADHLSAAPYIKAELGGQIAIGKLITQVQQLFSEVFDESKEFNVNGEQFDHLFANGEHYHIGNLKAFAMQTPGHTPACMTHVIGDAAFVGDTLFMPDGGTARVDFPGGDAQTLFNSIQDILALPADTRIFVCHDYQPNDRELRWESSVQHQQLENIHIRTGTSMQSFVEMRTARDATLGLPRLIIPSLQVNMRAGNFPEKSKTNNTIYLKVPINKMK